MSDLLGSVSQLASEAPLPNKNAAYAVYNYTCAIGAASGLSTQTEAYMNSFPNALKYRQFACALPIIEWLVPKIVDFAAAKLGATNKQALKQKIVNKALKAMLSTAITTAFTPKQYLEKVIEITTAMLDEIKNLVSGNAALQYLAEKEFKKFIGKVAAGILNVLSGTGSIVMSAAEFAILSPVESFYVELGTPTWKAVVPTIAVTIDPATATVNQNQDQTFTATVTGSSNTGVTWAVNSATGTTLTPNGNTVTLRSSVAGNYSVTATSVADGSKNASSSVTVSIGGRVGMGILKQSQQRVSTH